MMIGSVQIEEEQRSSTNYLILLHGRGWLGDDGMRGRGQQEGCFFFLSNSNRVVYGRAPFSIYQSI